MTWIECPVRDTEGGCGGGGGPFPVFLGVLDAALKLGSLKQLE